MFTSFNDRTHRLQSGPWRRNYRCTRIPQRRAPSCCRRTRATNPVSAVSMARELQNIRSSGRNFVPAKRRAQVLRALLASCIALALAIYSTFAPLTPRTTAYEPYAPPKPNLNGDPSLQKTHAVGNETLSRVQPLIQAAGSNIFLLDLNLCSGGQHSSSSSRGGDRTGGVQPPWFEGFVTSGSETSAVAAAVTVGHPIRRMLSYFREEAVDLETSLSWLEDEGETHGNRGSRPCRGFKQVEQGGGVKVRGDVFAFMHRLSHRYHAETEYVGFSPTRQALLAPSAKRSEVSSEWHEPWAASY